MGLLVTLLVIFIIIVLLGLLIWYFWPDIRNIIHGGGTQPTAGSIGSSCSSSSSCNTGLICDSATSTCRNSTGGTCSTDSDCVTGDSCVSGVCAASGTGGLNQPCDTASGQGCATGYTCVGNLCKASPGTTCSQNTDCSNNNCVSGVCSTSGGGLANGAACQTNNQCSSANCSSYSDGNSYCQPATINSGALGAVCNSNNTPGCNTGLSCTNGSCNSVSTNILFSACSSSPCASGLDCVSESSQICIYPQSDANLATNPGGTCPDGTTPVGGYCMLPTGGPCVADTFCASSTCSLQSSNGTPVYSIAVYRFGDLSTVWQTPVALPTNVTHFDRIEVVSQGTSDILYGFSSDSTNGGIFQYQFGSSPTWTQLVPRKFNYAGPDSSTQDNEIKDFSVAQDNTVFMLCKGTIGSKSADAIFYMTEGDNSPSPWYGGVSVVFNSHYFHDIYGAFVKEKGSKDLLSIDSIDAWISNQPTTGNNDYGVILHSNSDGYNWYPQIQTVSSTSSDYSEYQGVATKGSLPNVNNSTLGRVVKFSPTEAPVLFSTFINNYTWAGTDKGDVQNVTKKGIVLPHFIDMGSIDDYKVFNPSGTTVSGSNIVISGLDKDGNQRIVYISPNASSGSQPNETLLPANYDKRSYVALSEQFIYIQALGTCGS